STRSSSKRRCSSSVASWRTSPPISSWSRTATKRTELPHDDEHECRPVEEGVHDHPGQDAVRAVAKPSERDAKRNEDEQRLDEAVRDAEGDPHEQDRRRAAEETEEGLARTAEGQLLDEGRNQREEDQIRCEGTRVRWFPVHVGDPLLSAGALGQRQLRD